MKNEKSFANFVYLGSELHFTWLLFKIMLCGFLVMYGFKVSEKITNFHFIYMSQMPNCFV